MLSILKLVEPRSALERDKQVTFRLSDYFEQADEHGPRVDLIRRVYRKVVFDRSRNWRLIAAPRSWNIIFGFLPSAAGICRTFSRWQSAVWRAVDQHGAALDVLVQSRRDRHAARRMMRKLLRKHGRSPRVLITDKLMSYAAANRDLGLNVEHRQRKGLNNRAENSHQPTRVREKVMRRFKSARHLQRFTSVHDQVANLFMHCRYNANAQDKRQARTQAFEAWETVTGNSMLDRLAA